MGTAETLRSWRDELRDYFSAHPQSKQEIAEIIGFVSVRTIDRWISGQVRPRNHEHIRKLAALSPEMRKLLEQEFPDAFSKQSLPIERINLPVEFSRRILHAYAHTPINSLRWTVFHQVERAMIPHLDPEKTGLALVYVREDGDVEAIQFGEGAGNSVWITRQAIAETCREPWLVQIVRAAQPCFIQSLIDAALEIPFSCFAKADLIQSVGFFPLYRAGVAGGGILLLSASTDFFTPLRQTLLEEYTYLLALAFRDADFC